MIASPAIPSAEDYGAFLESLRAVLVRQAYRFIAEIWSTRLEVDDLTQEAMLLLWRKRELVQASADPTSYAVTAAKNGMLMYIRREVNPSFVRSLDKQRRGPDGRLYTREIDAASVVSCSPANDQARQLVLAMAKRLTALQRQALFLVCEIEGEQGPLHRRDWKSDTANLYRQKYLALKKLRQAGAMLASNV